MLNKIARWRSQAGKALLMLLCILASVNGQDFEHRQPANPDSALANILGQLHGAPLSLADAQQKALQNNAPLRQAEAVRNAANATVRRERGRRGGGGGGGGVCSGQHAPARRGFCPRRG